MLWRGLLKSQKNKIEIENIKKSHIYDGVALTKFLFWIKNTKEPLNEISASRKLENIRKKKFRQKTN